MAVPARYLLLAAIITALCQGACTMPMCKSLFSSGFRCTFFSCSTTDVDVICLYRNTSTVRAPKWYLDDERIFLDSLQLTEYNDTVWQMVYNYSALSPGDHVFYGAIEGTESDTLRNCCGPQPEVLLNVTVAADNPTDDDKKDELDSVVLTLCQSMKEDKKEELDSIALKLGQSMKELVLTIVGIVDEATGDDPKH